jgi:glycosyltransferase involved in cell wall biosynthesis
MMDGGRLRFCMITTFYPPYAFGGDGLFVYHLSNALAERGHEVEVIHCIDSYQMFTGGGDLPALPHHHGVTVHGLRSRAGFVSPLATHQSGVPFMQAGKIRRLLERGFDVIHFHNVSLVGGPGLLAMGAGRKLYTMHEYWIECPTHDLYRFGRAPCERPWCLACSLAHGRPPQLWRYTPLMNWALKQVNLFLAPSRFMLERFRRAQPGLPVQYLPNFVPVVNGVAPVRVSASASTPRPYFLYVGRLEPIKGVQTLIPLFREHSRAMLVIAGTGRQEAELRRQARNSDAIRFLGHVEQADLVPWYENAVAVILPSLWYEVFPLVILEAFRSGAPVLCRKLGSPPGIIAESGGGLSFEDEADLARAMARLLDEPGTRSRLGQAGQRYFREHWTTEVHLARYFELLSQSEPASGPAGRSRSGRPDDGV